MCQNFCLKTIKTEHFSKYINIKIEMNLCSGKTAKVIRAQLRSMSLPEIYLEQYHSFSFTKVSNGFVSSKIYDKRDDFDFDIVNFPFLDGDVPRSTSYGVYISQLIRFARVSSHVADFNARNKSLTNKLLQQGYRYHELRKTFSKFYRRHYELVFKFNVGLKTLLHQGLSEPGFYGDNI